MPRYASVYQGALGFEMKTGFVPDLKEFLNSLLPRQLSLTEIMATVHQFNGSLLESKHDLKGNNQECDLHGSSAITHTIPSLEVTACLASSNKSHSLDQLPTLKAITSELGAEGGQPLTDSKIIPQSLTQRNFSHGKILTTEKDSQRLLPLDAWAEIFNCTWGAIGEDRAPCTGAESLRETTNSFTDVSRFQYGFTTYLAVYTVAYALRDMRACSHGQGPFENGSCALPYGFEPWQLLLYIRNVRFTNSLGEEQWFDENGDPPPRYELVNVKIDNRTSVLNVVGSFDLNKGLQVDLPQVWWNSECQEIPRSICSKPCMPGTRIVSLRGQPSCCFECVPCTSGEVSNITELLIRDNSYREPQPQAIQQPLDHFDFNCDKTIPQRFWVNTNFWNQRCGPVFLYIGGESKSQSPKCPLWWSSRTGEEDGCHGGCVGTSFLRKEQES
uniref:uncharacterized protein n=1 Tax=Myxine glutinosa TaxID=7769 RepID=UPI00358F568B